MKYNTNKLKDYLKLDHPLLIKQYLWCWLLLFPPIHLIIALAPPFHNLLSYLTFGLVIFNMIYTIFMMIYLKKNQKHYVLYLGVYCFISSILFLLGFCKLIYYSLNITSVIPISVAIIIYFFVILIGGIYLLRWLNSDNYPSKQKYTRLFLGGIGITSAIGLLVGRILIKNTSESTGIVILAVSLLILGYFVELGIHNIYKYSLIKRYENYVEVHDVETLKKK